MENGKKEDGLIDAGLERLHFGFGPINAKLGSTNTISFPQLIVRGLFIYFFLV